MGAPDLVSAPPDASAVGRRTRVWLRVLGSAAGGGSPQWNCGCPVCTAVRCGAGPARTQSSVAVSADRRRWFLINASPDVRMQIEAFPDLHPRDDRTTPLEAVLLTDGELDHTLGLLLLREARALRSTPRLPCTRSCVTARGCCARSSATARSSGER